MNFLVDDQLPVALARWIGRQGQTANHLKDVSLTGRIDDDVWRFAQNSDAILVTMDDDFLQRHRRENAAVRLIFLGWGNLRKRELLRRFEFAWPKMFARLSAGDRLVREP